MTTSTPTSGTTTGSSSATVPAPGSCTYGAGGAEDHRLRGARVFHLDENAEEVYAGTELRFAADYGIDLDPTAQPGEPSAFPDGVR